MAARTLVGVLVVGLVSSLSAQQPSTLQQKSNAVEIAVSVTDAEGNFVPGLTAKDFEVREHGRPQALGRTSEMNAEGGVYLLVIEAPVSFGRVQSDTAFCPALGYARDFVAQSLRPGDVVGVWEGDAGRVSLTQDRSTALGRLTTANAVSYRSNLRGSPAGLRSAVDALEAIQGRRKSLVVFTCGWFGGLVRPADRPVAPGDEYALQRRFRDYEGFHLSGRADVTVYPINTVGVSTPLVNADNPTLRDYQGFASSPYQPAPINNDIALERIAHGTGGFAIYGSNDPHRAFGRIVEDNRHYYLLSYEPPIRKGAGQFVDVKVTAKDPGLTVRARDGYFGR